jgi:hypothetical protein
LKTINRNLLLIFVLTLIFLLVFPGLYSYLEIFYPGWRGQSEYEWWAFKDGKVPSKADILLFGFKDVLNLFSAAVISVLVTWAAYSILHHKLSRLRWLNIVIISLVLVLILSVINFSYSFLLYKFKYDFNNSLIDENLRPQVALFVFSSLLIYTPIIAFGWSRIHKD